jgi:uncharacterized protein (DUF697 family)
MSQNAQTVVNLKKERNLTIIIEIRPIPFHQIVFTKCQVRNMIFTLNDIFPLLDLHPQSNTTNESQNLASNSQ